MHYVAICTIDRPPRSWIPARPPDWPRYELAPLTATAHWKKNGRNWLHAGSTGLDQGRPPVEGRARRCRSPPRRCQRVCTRHLLLLLPHVRVERGHGLARRRHVDTSAGIQHHIRVRPTHCARLSCGCSIHSAKQPARMPASLAAQARRRALSSPFAWTAFTYHGQ